MMRVLKPLQDTATSGAAGKLGQLGNAQVHAQVVLRFHLV